MEANHAQAALFFVLIVALWPTPVAAQGRSVEMGITAPEMAQWFQQHADANDIARVDHPNDIGLISGITVGKKMVIFKSASQIQAFMATNASSLDIIGYNLEPGQAHDAAELANPVAAAQAVRSIANQYGKLVAIGLTHDLTLRYGAVMAPYADIWVLQIQRAQNDPRQASEFVAQMAPALTAANPAIQVFVQIRTDSQPAALAKLVSGLGNVHVSILTQRSDVQDAINVASVFFGGGSGQTQTISNQPASWVNDYGIRIPSKLPGCLAPVASRLIGSNENDHTRRGSPTLAYDWSAAVGSPVFSICPGTVRRTSSANEGGYGWNVVIDHQGGYSTLYAHCLENSFRVKAGDKVTAWTQICSIGRTGMTSWPHVHLNIDYNGVHQPVGKFFDSSLIHYCHFTKCQSTNRPSDPIRGSTIAQSPTSAGQQPATAVSAVAQTRYAQLLRILAQYPPQVVSLAIMALLGLLVLIYWLGGRVERVAIVGGVSGMAGAALIVWLMVPMGTVQAGQQPAISGDGTTWDKVYPIVQSMEGWACTKDGAYTMGGVTQSTYNRWRAKKSMGSADVCANLTRAQAKAIYYELFWLPIGADKMPAALALTAVDHYINTGKVSHLLAQCGQDVACFNRARIADYQTKGNCATYCQAWINRVNKIRKYTGG